ncbi:hypothetical protein ABL78_6118 [Leptomonas seymouri]|uniref:LisH domain-containing protein n=1 Tax=Leptomonas seymouri TaxID=5684 RepID=A0A0N1I1A2_LEPSE|nr:hypothetical protein ABL78_6118 [Leptomonas seymouri]|eukprot:KPI84834.1 hypothetical protein ABL78_6118 [Leptomonas seymouri]
MDFAPSCSDAPEGARELTKSDVLAWLKRHNFNQAFKALELEAGPSPDTSASIAVHLPREDNDAPNASLGAELGDSLEEALSAYQQLTGEGSVYALLDHWDPKFLSTYHIRRATGGTGLERSNFEKKIAELQESNNRLRARERELDTQLKQAVTIIAERLQALVTSIDPMRKDILLPFLRIVAVFGSSSSVRAAARHMMLTLYKRPIVEHRLAILQEWLRIARESPSRSLEQELIPELYSLVNAQAFERRLLALDCAAAAAPLLLRSPQVRYSLCQGLLRPLCEDDTSAVRRELPRCLSLLWGDLGSNSAGNVLNDAGGGGLTLSDSGGAASTFVLTSAAAAGNMLTATNTAATCLLSPSQQSFVMELLVHLATDTNSRSVRQAAQTQLCEVLYPVFLRDGVLLTQFVPLLLTVVSMEASQMLLQRKPNTRTSGSGGESTTLATGSTRDSAANEAATAVASALSLNNVMTLVQLLHAALRCVAAEVVHSREEDDRCGERIPQAAVTATATAAAMNNIAASLAATYVDVVLPTAHNLLTPLLTNMRYVPLAVEDGAESCDGGVRDPCTQLCGPLCALCATLASLVPLLGAQAWDSVTRFLKASVLVMPALHTGTAACRDAPSSFAFSSSHDAAQDPQEFLRGRLLFAYSCFILLSGDAVVLAGNGEQATKQGTASATTTGNSAAHRRESDAVGPSSQSLLTTKRIQLESLSFLAHQIRLEFDDLTSPRSVALTTCVHCIASLAPFAQESHEVSSGVIALICFLVSSTDPRLRLTAVVLVHDTCAAIANEQLKVAVLLEPLQPLLEDPEPLVREAALAGVLSVAVALTEPRAQEKTIQPVLRVADAAGSTSRFTRCFLVQWDQLMQRMPAEPREALLYPQLAVLMDQLAEQFVARASREGMTPLQASFTNAEDKGATRTVLPRESQDNSVEQWESTMLILQTLLQNILRCAVVTPTLVSRYLLPGVQQLASEGVLSACSSSVRTRWSRLLKSYLMFSESNAGRVSTFTGTPQGGNLLDRVKDELKRRF